MNRLSSFLAAPIQVTGYILDEFTNEPVANVNVFVVTSIVPTSVTTLYANGTSSNQYGKFTLPYNIEPNEKVTFSHQTYGTIVLTASEIMDNNGLVKLSEFVNDLDEVVITAPTKSKFSWKTVGLLGIAGVLIYSLASNKDKPLKVKL